MELIKRVGISHLIKEQVKHQMQPKKKKAKEQLDKLIFSDILDKKIKELHNNN